MAGNKSDKHSNRQHTAIPRLAVDIVSDQIRALLRRLAYWVVCGDCDQLGAQGELGYLVYLNRGSRQPRQYASLHTFFIEGHELLFLLDQEHLHILENLRCWTQKDVSSVIYSAFSALSS